MSIIYSEVKGMNNFKEKWLGLEADETIHVSDVLWLAVPSFVAVAAFFIALSTY